MKLKAVLHAVIGEILILSFHWNQAAAEKVFKLLENIFEGQFPDMGVSKRNTNIYRISK